MIDPRLYYTCLRNAIVFIRKCESIAFVLSNTGQKQSIAKIVNRLALHFGTKMNAEAESQVRRCASKIHVISHWVPGLLTNWKGVGYRHAVKYVPLQQHADVKNGQLHGRHEFVLQGGYPDVLVCFHPAHPAIQEARSLGIPILLLSTHTNNLDAEYCIPINPYSYTQVYHCLNAVCKGGFGSSGGRAED